MADKYSRADVFEQQGRSPFSVIPSALPRVQFAHMMKQDGLFKPQAPF
jgi:hypothetical protein